MNASLVSPFDPRGEIADIRDDATQDEVDAEVERREAQRNKRPRYWERMVIDTTPGVGLDPEGRLTYSTLTPVFSDTSDNRRYGGAS